MSQVTSTGSVDTSGTFLRIVGTLGAILAAIILLIALVAPHISRLSNLVLHWTWYRHWIASTLHADQPVFDAASPVATVQSYYSALYQGNTTHLQHLTQGVFHEQLQNRLHRTEGVQPGTTTTYHSYLWLAQQTGQDAIIYEKLHLFWRQGLRFVLRRTGTDWAIVAVDVIP